MRTRGASGSLTMLPPALTDRAHVCSFRPPADCSVVVSLAGRVTRTQAGTVTRRESTIRFALATWKASVVCGGVPPAMTRSIADPSTARALPA